MLCRILTENCPENRNAVLELTSLHFDGFTLLYGRGYWKGTPEETLIIEVSNDKFDDEEVFFLRVRSLAGQIKKVNHQEAVLIQRIECGTLLV